uniref:syntenin-1-like isoform X2 n=1 Tax=Myxine glutinosa TaxID=7769 RepID=UPI00358F49C0
MSLYPSLEDMKVDQALQAQEQFAQQQNMAAIDGALSPQPRAGAQTSSLYPTLDEYMGLSLTSDEISRNMPLVVQHPAGPLSLRPSGLNQMVAPVTGNDIGLRRAETQNGIREVILCKDGEEKIGLRLRAIDKGIFIQLVQAGKPAALVGLRFGDQVLQIDGQNCCGWDADKAHKALKKASAESIVMAVRDRPFERTITMHKGSAGYVGFTFKNGKITSIAKDTSAARNGLLIDHHLCEVNGQNVIGVKDMQISEILQTSGSIITLTIMPSYVYDHIMKKMAFGLVKKQMDHSIPEV